MNNVICSEGIKKVKMTDVVTQCKLFLSVHLSKMGLHWNATCTIWPFLVLIPHGCHCGMEEEINFIPFPPLAEMLSTFTYTSTKMMTTSNWL